MGVFEPLLPSLTNTTRPRPHLLYRTLPTHLSALLPFSTTTLNTQTELTAYEKFPEPREVEELKVTANKKELGVSYKKDAKAIADALEALPEDEADCLRKTLESGECADRVHVCLTYTGHVLSCCWARG